MVKISCLAGTRGNLEEMNTVVEASALDINEKEDLNNDKRMGVCVAINIPMAAIPETRENNFSSSPRMPVAICHLHLVLKKNGLCGRFHKLFLPGMPVAICHQVCLFSFSFLNYFSFMGKDFY